MSVLKATIEWLELRRLAFILLFLAWVPFTNLFDPDYFWHLTAGQYIFEHRGLPAGDIFSFTQPGKTWILHEWLFELVMYCFHSLLGPLGVKLLTAAMATATAVVAYGMTKRLLDKPYPALYLTLLFFAEAARNVSPRPQLVTLLLFAVFLRVLLDFKYFRSTHALWLLPLLMVVWVNAHGGYVAGLALMMLFAACEWLIYLARQPDDEQHKRRLNTLALVTLTTALASLLNPYFINHWLYPFYVMGMDSSLAYIAEWHSPDFHKWPDQVFLALVLASLALAIYRRVRPDLTEIAVTLFFVTAGFVSMRHIPIAMLALLPFAAVTLAQLKMAQLVPARWIERYSSLYRRHARGSDLGRKEFAINWLFLFLAIAACLLYYPVRYKSDAEKANYLIPIKATEFILKAGIEGRMFNIYHYGGYLIYRLYPKQKVFIDGRNDMYGDNFLNEYTQIESGRGKWKNILERYKIDYAVISSHTPLIRLMQAEADFRVVYEDEAHAVLVKNGPKFAEIIAKYAHDENTAPYRAADNP